MKKIVDEHGARIDIRNREKAADGAAGGAQISILFLQLADGSLGPPDHAVPAHSEPAPTAGRADSKVQNKVQTKVA